jgi:hypothetical protein
MKLKLKTITLVLITVAGLLFSQGSALAQHAIIDVWNININGALIGTGYLYFFGDNTIQGYIATRPNMNIKPANQPAVFDVGFFGVIGEWFDTSKAGAINPNQAGGFFSGGSENIPFEVQSFKATVRSNATLSMSAVSSDGKLKISGVPVSSPAVLNLTPLTGDWTAQVIKDGVKFHEVLTLLPSGTVCTLEDRTDPDNPICLSSVPAVNTYDFDGDGPGYQLSNPAKHRAGKVVLSAGNRIALVVKEYPIDKDTLELKDTGPVRTVVGNYNGTYDKATMTGDDDDHAQVLMNMSR